MSRYTPTLIALVLLLSSHPRPALATEWFVAPGGSGPGSPSAPLGRVQDALSSASAGDVITVRAGTYVETLRTVRAGAADAPIVVRAEPEGGPVVIANRGTVLRVDHPHVTVEGLVFDGQYGNAVAVDVNAGGSFLVLRSVEVRRSGRDCIDISAAESVLIEDSLIHHCLYPLDGRSDAHGIVGGAVRDLTIRGTEIHTFSGDGIQIDPGRTPAGWDRVLVESSRIWLAPLPAAENGFAAGTVPGENALDTKVADSSPRARLIVRDTLAWGFRGTIENQAAFNIKENVDVTIDGVTIWDSEIAFRLRGPTSRAGAWVTVQNTVVHNVATAVRYEDNIENLKVWNSTLGLNVGRAFQAASSASAGVDVRNLLVLGPQLPREAMDRSNLAVSQASFVDAAGGNYQLAERSPAIDAGAPLRTVVADRAGIPRPQGGAPDVGAYEWHGPTVMGRPEGVFGPSTGR